MLKEYPSGKRSADYTAATKIFLSIRAGVPPSATTQCFWLWFLSNFPPCDAVFWGLGAGEVGQIHGLPLTAAHWGTRYATKATQRLKAGPQASVGIELVGQILRELLPFGQVGVKSNGVRIHARLLSKRYD
jgi:hypothetical protein